MMRNAETILAIIHVEVTGEPRETETVRHGTHGVHGFQRRPKVKADDFEATHLP
jgi:hypothetical protein